MRKVFVSVNDCRPGMKLAEDIFNEYGAVIITENTILDSYIIGKIISLGLKKIKVYDQTGDMIVVSGAELFRAQYNENVQIVKKVLHDIATGKEINSERVNEAADSIIIRINENRDIVNCINEMRENDEYLYTHCINVSLLAMLIGKWLKYDYTRIRSLVSAGILHDIGKSKISQDILNKPGPLTAEEFSEIKKHSVYGYKIAEAMPGLNDDILKGILMHHEREDGTGYPFGLKSEQIHDFGKIIAVADIYDAMTSNKAYRSKVCPFEVIEHMEKENFGILDHRVVSIFLKNIAAYYIGDFVKLSTGDIGEVIYINPNNISKPIIRIDDVFFDLANEKEMRILELL